MAEGRMRSWHWMRLRGRKESWPIITPRGRSTALPTAPLHTQSLAKGEQSLQNNNNNNKKKTREQIPDHSRSTDLSTLHLPLPPDQTGTAALDGSKPHSEAPAPQISLTLSRSSLRTSDLFKIVAWQPLDLPKLGRNIPSKRHRPAWPRLCPLPAQGRILIASPAPFQSHVFLFLPLVFFCFFFFGLL